MEKDQQLPKTFKALVLKQNLDVNYEDISYDFDNLDDDYIVIQVKTAGIGPFDLGHILGRLRTKELGEYNLGVEGAGIAVKVGKNCESTLIGKRVGFLASHIDPKTIRAFSEYSVIHKDYIMALPDEVDLNQGAYILGSPLTAKCMFQFVIQKYKCKSIILDVASSALGKIINKLCKKAGVKVINIVRKEENIQLLKEIGAMYSYNSTSTEFLNTLSQVIKELQPNVYLSFMGGSLPSKVFELMPNDSIYVSAGSINNEKLTGFSSTSFIFSGKQLEGFQIWNVLREIGNEQKVKLLDEICNDLKAGEDTYYTTIAKEYALSNFEEARKDYENNMSKGKIILNP